MNLTKLEKLHPCTEALDWLRVGNFRNEQEAWDACERGDWMLWLLDKLSGPVGSRSRKKLVLAACACARLALQYVPTGEDRPRVCIETAERYCEGKATLKEVRESRAAAYAAAYAAADAAAAAADAAAAAAYAAADAADAAYAATATAYAAYAAAYAADAARIRMLSRCAEVVRQSYPTPPRL